MAERRTYQGHTYERADPGQPWTLVGPAQDAPQQQGGGSIISSPTQPYDIQKARAQAQTATAEAPYAADTAAATVRETEAKAKLAEFQAMQAQAGVAEQTATIRSQALGAYKAAENLDGIIAEMEQHYKEGPGATKGIMGLGDFLPMPSNQRFNKAADAARGAAIQALGFTSGQTNTAAEAQLNLGGYIPSAGQFDATITDSIERLKRLRDNAKAKAVQILGGVPDANGRITPVPQGKQAVPGATPPAPPSFGPGGGAPPSGGGGAPRDQADRSNTFIADPSHDPMGVGIATGATAQQPDPANSALIDRLVRQGANADQINFALFQANPHASGGVSQASVDAAQAWLKTPDGRAYKGSMGSAMQSVPVAEQQRNRGGALLSPLGTGAAKFMNAVGSGLPGAVSDDARQALDIASTVNPKSALAGDVLGTGALAFGAGAAGGALPGIAGQTMRAGGGIVPDIMVGSARGAAESNDDRLGGAITGGLLAAGGNLGGRYVLAPAAGAGIRLADRTGRSLFGLADAPQALLPGERSVVSALNRTGMPEVERSLTQAADLNVPMALADVSGDLNSLTGAAVRRSPTAGQAVRDTMQTRGRGQYDRLNEAIAAHLGPVENVPKLSEDLIKGAKAKAGPLYDQAYAAPGAGAVFPHIQDMLQRPSMSRALANARRIVMEEGGDPTALGFDLTKGGEVKLTRVPSWQTLDYVKRGMDDVVEGYRDPTSGRLNLDTEGRAVNGTLRDFLGVVDKYNPAYAEARAAYAGPASESGYLSRGQKALDASPSQLGVDTAGLSPERMGQMQLGFQSGLSERAGGLRHQTNPFEATLGTPRMEERLGTMYPGREDDIARLLMTRDLERGVASSSNRLIGNSMTAERGAADQAFDQSSGMLPLMADAGMNMAVGQVPVSAMRQAAANALRDRMALGLGNRAVTRAEQIAPLTTVADPVDSLEIARNLMLRDQARSDYLARTTPRDLSTAIALGLLVGPATTTAVQ